MTPALRLAPIATRAAAAALWSCPLSAAERSIADVAELSLDFEAEPRLRPIEIKVEEETKHAELERPAGGAL
jgi:hypothetical protein